MQRGSSTRKAAHPIHPLFIDRWSPRSMSGEPLTEAELMVLFEAARWAPSSSNFQPWRMLYVRRGTPLWSTYVGLLFEGNRVWAQHAGAIVLFLSKTVMDDGRPCTTHSYDTGAAWQNFALQAYLQGYALHGIGGFDAARARTELKIPPEYAVEAMAVIGKLGNKADLPDHLQAREQPNGRRPLSETVAEGLFSF
ncbi:MAG TPA: nitroreductase family protein [Steroidobacteraceae bacterium]|nr:nitroreductase family protein [Steroidobacteraceae bacterium]